MTVDLRSDTVTRPTPGMRAAMAGAVVGDDVLGDDTTVAALEERVAGLLGKEAALFMPSGVMANTVAILSQAAPGTEVVMDADAHVVNWEDGATAMWGGVQIRTHRPEDGLPVPERVEAAMRDPGPYTIRTSVVCLENTHNGAGGRVLPLERGRRIAELARARGLRVHLDGARLWNAAAAGGRSLAELADCADTVMVTLSKGLGCPVGSVLALPAELRDRAWRIRRRLGGAMRQSGVLAAAALYALDHHLDRLSDDHRRAADLAAAAAGIDGVGVVTPETNIVMVHLPDSGPDADAVKDALEERGVRMSRFSRRRLRAVTHLDVDDDGIRQAGAALAEVLV
ncbi:MAG: GntG family PLP-dependent aldolase [Gemmatimonadota bacterium]